MIRAVKRLVIKYPLKKISISDLAVEVKSKLDGKVYTCDANSCRVNNTARGFVIVFEFDSNSKRMSCKSL